MEYKLVRFSRIWWIIIVVIIFTYVAVSLWSPKWLFWAFSIKITLFDIFSSVVFLYFLFLSCASSVMVKVNHTEQPEICPLTAMIYFLKYRKLLPLVPSAAQEETFQEAEPKTVPEAGRRRSAWQKYLLLTLLICVLVGGYILLTPILPEVKQSEDIRYTLFFAIVSFSIAFAIHYFSVSIALCNLIIRAKKPEVRRQLRELEYSIVSSGLLVLAGGLTLLLAGASSLLIRFNLFPFPICESSPCVAVIYTIGAIILFSGYVRYTFGQSGWPRAAAIISDP